MKKWFILAAIILSGCGSWQDIEGNEIQGEGWTLLSFWAPWCEMCMSEFGALEEIAQSGTNVIAYSIENTPLDELQKLNLDTKHITHTNQLPKGLNPNFPGVPAHFVRTPDGKWHGPKMGEISPTKMASWQADIAAGINDDKPVFIKLEKVDAS